MRSFCLEHHELLQVYRLDNCLPGLKASAGYSWLWLLDDLLLCFVDLSVSVWVSTFCSNLHCILPCASSRPHWSPEEGNSCWNTAKQFCWHSPCQVSFTQSELLESEHCLRFKRKCRQHTLMRIGTRERTLSKWVWHRSIMCLQHSALGKKLTPFSYDSWDNPKGKCQMHWLLLGAVWFQPRSL